MYFVEIGCFVNIPILQLYLFSFQQLFGKVVKKSISYIVLVLPTCYNFLKEIILNIEVRSISLIKKHSKNMTKNTIHHSLAWSPKEIYDFLLCNLLYVHSYINTYFVVM